MSTISARDASIEVASAKALGRRFRGWVFAPPLLAAALAAAYEVNLALETPGQVIRHELIAAGSALERLPWSTPSDAVKRSVARSFAATYDVTVDVKGFPVYVTATLHNVGHDACRDAYRVASRIEGRVVIVVDQRTRARPCSDDTAMTWRIMP
jgi:hypothetical protein